MEPRAMQHYWQRKDRHQKHHDRHKRCWIGGNVSDDESNVEWRNTMAATATWDIFITVEDVPMTSCRKTPDRVGLPKRNP
jgi:hypothetical protein